MFLKKQTKNKGSLLIEVLLSVVILATALTLMIQSMTAGVRVLQTGSGYTTALVLLDNLMAEILRRDTIAAGIKESGDLTDSAPVYRYSLQTKPSDMVAEDKISQAQVSISWHSGKRENTVNLTTFLFAPSDFYEESLSRL